MQMSILCRISLPPGMHQCNRAGVYRMRYGTLANVRFCQCALLLRFAVKKYTDPQLQDFMLVVFGGMLEIRLIPLFWYSLVCSNNAPEIMHVNLQICNICKNRQVCSFASLKQCV